MPLTHYSKFSMFKLQIWVFKSGVLKNLFILSKHGAKANIRSAKMANNRLGYNRDVLQSYWTSDGLPLYCSRPTGEKTHKPTMWKTCQDPADHGQHLIVTTGHCSVWLDGCHSHNTGCPIDICQQEQLETVWNQRNLSQGESLSVHCWQTDIDEHVWHGVL